MALCGVVAMQVSLLKLNAGISQAVERVTDFEQKNAGLEAKIAQLSSGERIRMVAENKGMIMPPAGSVGFLRVKPALDSERALLSISLQTGP